MFANPEEAFGGTRKLLSLVDEIYSTVHVTSMWTSVVESIAEALDGESTCIFAQFPKQNLYAMARTDPSSWDSYATYYAGINPIADRCDAIYADGEVRYSQYVVSDAELVKTEFYNDFFQHNDMHYAIGIALPMGEFPTAHISCQRKKGKGPFEQSKGVVYETLFPHLQRALLLNHQMGALQIARSGLETALEAHEHAVIGLDQDGCIILCNPRAAAQAQAGDGIRIVREKLCCKAPAADKQLKALISSTLAASAGIAAGTNSALLVHRRPPKKPLQITATPFHSALVGQARRIAALVFLADPSDAPRSRASLMAALYGLTPTEARVADLLMQGVDTSEIPQRLRIAQETYRFHVKRILAKTGARKQPELMRLMLSLPSA